MRNLLSQFVRTNRNYRGYDLSHNIVEKVFNRGCGSLGLFRFYPDKKIIVINKLLYNKSDERKLNEFCRDTHIEDWQRVFTSLGYPEWYTKRLHLPA